MPHMESVYPDIRGRDGSLTLGSEGRLPQKSLLPSAKTEKTGIQTIGNGSLWFSRPLQRLLQLLLSRFVKIVTAISPL